MAAPTGVLLLQDMNLCEADLPKDNNGQVCVCVCLH